MDLYQVCSNDGPWVENGPAAGGLGFKNEIYIKIFFSRTAWLRCLKFGMQHCLVVFYQVCSNQGPRVQVAPRHGVQGSNHRNALKYVEKSSSLEPPGPVNLKFGM